MRRFPPPWTFEDHNNACFIVRDTVYAPHANSYYNQDTGNLRYGHANDPAFDSYGGTR
jgi:hypothetical protein